MSTLIFAYLLEDYFTFSPEASEIEGLLLAHSEAA
jgi:hypothetical protein